MSFHQRLPALYICHGAGPMPITSPSLQGGLPAHLQEIGKKVLKAKPDAILVVSAHYEEVVASVNSDSQPRLLFDYHGFEPAAYALKYDAPGHAELALRIRDLLRSSGLKSELSSGRGWDHGVFVPLTLMLPAADIPVVQLSLLKSLDAKEHLQLGQALAPLREQGVFIIASGMSFHNMRGFGGQGGEDSARFHSWLTPTLCNSAPDERLTRLERWVQAPSARECHPREEHLLPLHVCVGAADGDKGHVAYEEVFMGVELASYIFGDWPDVSG